MEEGLTVVSGIVMMGTSMMGTGINYMPCAFNYVDSGHGCLEGALTVVGIGVLTFFSLCAVATAASRSKDPSPTYSSIASPMSRAFRMLVDISVFSCCFGANVAFYRNLGELVPKLFPFIERYIGNKEVARKMVVSVLAIPFFILGSKKNLSNLKITSYITVASVVYLAVLMVGYSVLIGGEVAEPPCEGFEPDVSKGIPYLILGMACQANMVKVYSELRYKSIANIVKIALGTAIFGTLIYGLVGMCGYIVFGRGVTTTIIESLIDPESPINRYLRENTLDKYALTSRAACVGAILVLFGAFPIQLNPLSGILVDYFKGVGDNRNMLRIGMAFLLVMSLLSFALVEDINTDTVLGLVGATSVNLTSFLYPFIYYIHYREKKASIMSVLAGAVGAMSIVAMFYMSYNILTRPPPNKPS